jgi:hypothetical protein
MWCEGVASEVRPAEGHTPLRGTNRFPRDTLMMADVFDRHQSYQMIWQQVMATESDGSDEVCLATQAGRIDLLGFLGSSRDVRMA